VGTHFTQAAAEGNTSAVFAHPIDERSSRGESKCINGVGQHLIKSLMNISVVFPHPIDEISSSGEYKCVDGVGKHFIV